MRAAVEHNIQVLKCIRGGLRMAEAHALDFDPRADYWHPPERRLAVAYLADRWSGRVAPVRAGHWEDDARPVRRLCMEPRAVGPSGRTAPRGRSSHDGRQLVLVALPHDRRPGAQARGRLRTASRHLHRPGVRGFRPMTPPKRRYRPGRNEPRRPRSLHRRAVPLAQRQRRVRVARRPAGRHGHRDQPPFPGACDGQRRHGGRHAGTAVRDFFDVVREEKLLAVGEDDDTRTRTTPCPSIVLTTKTFVTHRFDGGGPSRAGGFPPSGEPSRRAGLLSSAAPRCSTGRSTRAPD